jgi:hypothetical protein
MIFENDRNRLVCQGSQELSWIEPWGNDSIRVRKSPGRIAEDLETALVEPDARHAAPTSGPDPSILISEEGAVVRNGALEATIDRHGVIAFRRVSDTARE